MDLIKIIIMVTWFGLNILRGIESDDDIFMVGNKRCITNGSAALAIIKKINDTHVLKDNKRSSLYPTFKSNCTFESSSKCVIDTIFLPNDWSIIHAMDGPVDHYVTDERWEAFPMYRLHDNNIYTNVLSINTFTNFNLPLSIRIERNRPAHIYICDEDERWYYFSCYCMVLSEMHFSFWICEKASLDSSCRQLLSRNIHITFREDAWTHLRIVRKTHSIKVLRGNYVIMDYSNDTIYDSKVLLISSKGSNSLWKVHKYRYLFSKTIDKQSNQIDPETTISKDTTCISTFVALCKTCCLRITINIDNSKQIHQEISPQNGTWTKEKIIINTQNYVGKTFTILLYKYLCNGNSSQGLFWAMDKISLCEEKEYRYIESDEEQFTCQKIGNGPDEILKIDDNMIATTRVDCPENTFGKFCVPCNLFGNTYCGDFVYCDKDYSGQECHCTAGSRGSNCSKVCANGFYGHGCQKYCSEYRFGKCSRIFEKCVEGCEEPYDKAKKFISDDDRLAIEAHNETSDSVTISITKLDFEDLKGPIFLKGNAFCIHEWCSEKNVSEVIEYHVNSPFITLTKLFPYSNYTVNLEISRDRKSWIIIGQVEFQTKPSEMANSVMIVEKIIFVNTFFWMLFGDANQLLGFVGFFTTLHFLQISARNGIPQDYGPASETLFVRTRDEPSHPTYGISLLWDENNDLHISWYHPNVTNGRLINFEIKLENTEGGIQPTIKSDYVLYSEAYYNLTYTYTVPAAKLQACTRYKASIKVHNVHGESDFKHSYATSPPDISPNISIRNFEIDKSNSTITVYVPNIESRTPRSYDQQLYILVSKAAETEDLVLFEENLKRMEGIPDMKTSWIVYASNRMTSSLHFKIGDDNQPESSFENRPLEPGTNYSVSIIMSNECFGVMRLSRAQKYISTLENMSGTGKNTNDLPGPEESNGGLWALILLVLVPLIGFGYWCKKNKHHPNETDPPIPHEYETVDLPQLPNFYETVLYATPERPLSQDPPSLNTTYSESLSEFEGYAQALVSEKQLDKYYGQDLPPLNTTHSMPINVNDFEEYVKVVVTSGELARQYDLFPRGMVKPCEDGSLAENKTKNRFKNLIAYDNTRVKLRKICGDLHSDYINANYIDGYKKRRCYIATQGPKANTLADFWRMIWQAKVLHIVMLTNVYENGKNKLEKYWPDVNKFLTFGNVRVEHVSEDKFANFDIRVFTVHCDNEERKINQLHFTTWPEDGVPFYSESLVPFLQKIVKIPYNPRSPIVVHCGAGVGGTGTIILSDICLRMAAGEGSLDFLAYLENIRNQRADLVDNIKQYKLAHIVVLECLFGLHTAVPCNEQMKEIIDGILINDGIQKQMKYIVKTQWQDYAMEATFDYEEVFPNYPEKDRFKEIVPRNYRVFLPKYPVDNDDSFYINAVQVDGFRSPGRFISTQQPMPNTLGDFWRMVVERSCTTIISLNTLNLEDETVYKFWPDNGRELNPLDIIRVLHIKTKSLECYKVITVQVMSIRKEPFTVNILEMDNWKSNELLPNSIEEFLAFLDASEAISRNSEPVIVTCYDGATASGLYLAMTFLIEKMKLEQECDVCLAVRTIRHRRKEFVTKKEQYEFLYRASLTFIAGFQSYANFTC